MKGGTEGGQGPKEERKRKEKKRKGKNRRTKTHSIHLHCYSTGKQTTALFTPTLDLICLFIKRLNVTRIGCENKIISATLKWDMGEWRTGRQRRTAHNPKKIPFALVSPSQLPKIEVSSSCISTDVPAINPTSNSTSVPLTFNERAPSLSFHHNSLRSVSGSS